MSVKKLSLKNSSLDLTEGPIGKKLLLFAIPLLLSNLFQQLYNSVDTAVVGRYAGEASLAAVGSVGPLLNLIIGFFLGISTGAGIRYAQFFGAKDHKSLKKVMDTAIVSGAAAGAFISILGVIFVDEIMLFMHTPEEVMAVERTYLIILFAGTICPMVYNIGSGILRANGDSVSPLINLIIGGVTNFVLDVIFVAFLDWGVAGAAWGTCIAQCLAMILTLRCLTRLDERYAFNFKNIKPDREELGALVKISVPCGLQSSMFNAANLLVQIKINEFDTVAMAGITAFQKIDGFGYMPMMAMALAITTYVGQNVGAQKYDRVKKGIKTGILITSVVTIVPEIIILSFGRPLLSIFTSSVEAQNYGLMMMMFLTTTTWTFIIGEVFSGVVRGAGYPVSVTVIMAICVCAFRILWLTIGLSIKNDIRILFTCYPLSWILCSTAVLIYFLKSSKPIIKKIREAKI